MSIDEAVVAPVQAPTRTIRGDVDGLRAIAIVAVVAYHVGLPGFSGGFIGVDVFFVISGFLITRNLIAESGRTGGVALLAFWARRVRRLVPALAVMVAAVLVLSLFVLSDLQWQTVASQARAALLFVSNIVFARDATDYFGQGIGTSLFLHTWTLGVEEQFYLVWPVLVAAAVIGARRARWALRPVLAVAFGLTFAGSLALCVTLTAQGSASAFFGLPSRAWEFAAAGLLALLPTHTDRVTHADRARRVGRAVVAGGGLLLVAGAATTLDGSTIYPGLWPLIPVIGTLLILVAGTPGTPGSPDRPGSPGSGRANVVSRALAVGPMQWVGRVSYSWYLWHWPFILLAVAWLDRDRVTVRLGAALAGLGVAALAHHFVENPIRFRPALTRSLGRTFAMGAVVTGVLLLATFGLDRYSDHELAQKPGPSLADVSASRKEFLCDKQHSESGIEYCLDGDPNGSRTLLLIGDSHARHWKPAFAEVARQTGIRLLVRQRSACPAIPVRVLEVNSFRESVDCNTFHTDTDRLIDELHPDAIVISSSNDYGIMILGDRPIPTEELRAEVWGEAYTAFLEAQHARGIPVGAIADTPRMASNPLDCLAEKSADECAAPRDQALDTELPFARVERAARDQVGGVAVLDINDQLCDATTCTAEIHGIPVYVDLDHLYKGFVMTQLPAVSRFFDQLLR